MQSIKKSHKHQTILGVRIDSTNELQVLVQVGEFVAKKKKFIIFTPNPEIVLKAYQDQSFKKILNVSTISVPDGVGLKFAGSLYGRKLKIIRGRELFLKLLDFANKHKLKVFLLGPSDTVVKSCLDKIKKNYKELKADGATAANYTDQLEPIKKSDKVMHLQSISKIKQFKPDLLFVGLGAPKQERFLNKHMTNLPVIGGVGIGGAMDYFSGKAILPPKFVANLGFEWLWRLINEPRRFPRIINALIIFPFLVLKEKYLRVFDSNSQV